MNSPLLSICINTKNRSIFLKETLDSIVNQIDSRVEVVVVDGASTDDTFSLMQAYTSQNLFVKYFRSETHLGVDDGYDAAVKYASGNYCWLLPDDDLIMPGALQIILSNIKAEIDLIIVNMDLFTKDLRLNLNQPFFKLNKDRFYHSVEFEDFLSEHGNGLSYIGCVIIKRELWFENDRIPFFGTFFVHVGVILGSTLIKNIVYIHNPLIKYRSCNQSWSARSFDIWYFKWPKLIWSFNKITDETKNKITVREPWCRALTLLKSRAVGEYTYAIYKNSLMSVDSKIVRLYAFLIALIPIFPLNISLMFFCLMFKRSNLYTIYCLMISSFYPVFSKKMIQIFGLKIE